MSIYIYICLDIFGEFSPFIILSQLSLFLSWIWLVKYLSFDHKCDLDVNHQSVIWLNTFYSHRWLLLSFLRLSFSFLSLSQLYHWFQRTPDVQFLFPAQVLQQISDSPKLTSNSVGNSWEDQGILRQSTSEFRLVHWCHRYIPPLHDKDFILKPSSIWFFLQPLTVQNLLSKDFNTKWKRSTRLVLGSFWNTWCLLLLHCSIRHAKLQ